VAHGKLLGLIKEESTLKLIIYLFIFSGWVDGIKSPKKELLRKLAVFFIDSVWETHNSMKSSI